MVGDLEKSSFSNIEQQSLEFVKYTLDLWVARWEQAIVRRLFTEEEKKKHYVKFNVDGLLCGDYQSRMNGYAIITKPMKVDERQEKKGRARDEYKESMLTALRTNFKKVSDILQEGVDAEGESSSLYADGIVYFRFVANNGYSGDLEIALIPEWFRTEILKKELEILHRLIPMLIGIRAFIFHRLILKHQSRRENKEGKYA